MTQRTALHRAAVRHVANQLGAHGITFWACNRREPDVRGDLYANGCWLMVRAARPRWAHVTVHGNGRVYHYTRRVTAWNLHGRHPRHVLPDFWVLVSGTTCYLVAQSAIGQRKTLELGAKLRRPGKLMAAVLAGREDWGLIARKERRVA